MRWLIICILLVLPGISLAQTLLGMPVSLNRQSGTVGQFLTDLNSTGGLSLSYSSRVIDLSKRVQLTGAERTVEDILKAVLKGQNIKLVEENGKIILVAGRTGKYTVSGYITDKQNGERLPGASVFVQGTGKGTNSNAYGFFSITLHTDTAALLVSYAGYVPLDLSISTPVDTSLNISLERRTTLQEIVVVNAESRTNSRYRAIPGHVNVQSHLISSMPSLLGEADVLKTLQLLPGINSGNEGTSGLNVRGGSPDQNLILLDGVPVYNSSHAFGLFSIFNADAVHNVEVMKGGFPASYGGRLSSVVDVHMKEGDRYNFRGEGGIGLVFSKVTLEGPITKGRSSFLISARRTYADLIIRPIQKLQNEESGRTPYFNDLILKSNFPMGQKGRVYFSFYTGADKYKQRDKYASELNTQTTDYQFKWGNITGTARWNHELGKKLFGNLTFNYSRFKYTAQDREEFKDEDDAFTSIAQQNYFSGIRDLNFKYDLDFLPSPAHSIKTGFSVTRHRYSPGTSSFVQTDTTVKVNETFNKGAVSASELDVYLEDDVQFSPKIRLNAGLRLTGFLISGKWFTSLQPRMNLVYRLSDKLSLKASAVKMNQYIHLLTNTGMGFPTDLWVPVTTRLPPQVSYQYSAGASFRHEGKLEASMEVYYKNLENVIEYSENSGVGSSFSDWEERVEAGKGRSYGIEWMVQKTKGRVTGLVSYTYSRSFRTFANINEGKTFPYKYDRPHELKAALVWRPSARFELNANGMLATGNAISLPSAYYVDPVTDQVIDVYTSRNDYRLPVYHRVDVSLKFIKQKKRYLRTWIVSVYNVYNRRNAFYIYHYRDLQMDQVKFRQVSLFPIVPSLTYQFKF